MKLAILLLCHKNIEQINRLVSALYNKDVKIFIHVDKKVNDLTLLQKNDNVVILSKTHRVNVMWGEYSVAEAMLNLMHVARKKGDFDYYWFCSGQDYPIHNIEKIIEYLKKNKGKNFVHFYRSMNYKNGKENNYDKRNIIYYPKWLMKRALFPRCMKRIYVFLTGGYNRTWSLFKRRDEFSEIKSYFGSQWSCITGEFLNWMIDYIEENKWFLSHLKNSLVPDECIIQTLLMISPYNNTIADYLHYLIFKDGANSPEILTVKDIDDMIDSSALMARKFDICVDEEVLNILPVNKDYKRIVK